MTPRSSEGAVEKAAPALVDEAVRLAQSGWAVFPCKGNKEPLTQHGFKDASTVASEVERMDWARAEMIGAVVPPGQAIVDVDPRHGGDRTLAALLEAVGQRLPATRVVETAGGGKHYYFRVPEDASLRSKVGPGVDLKRAGKGYVIVPPSPGYSLARKDEVVGMPKWLLDQVVVEDRDRSADLPSGSKFFPWDTGTPYGIAALERTLGRLSAAEPGTRNDALNTAAFNVAQLVAGGELDEGRARGDLEDLAYRLFPEKHKTRTTIESGWAAGLLEPKQAPQTSLSPGGQEPPAQSGQPESRVQVEVGAEEGSPPGESDFWFDWEGDHEPPSFFLWPVIPRDGYVLVYGPTEASKSMVMMALGATASCRGIRVTFRSLENPQHVDGDRLRRLKPCKDNFRVSHEHLDVADPRQFQQLVEMERDWGDGRGTDILIIDTYSHAYHSRSEDGNAKAIEFAIRMRHLMKSVGCTVIVIDHTGYAHDEPRDASAKMQQVDVAILMKKVGEWQPGRPAGYSMDNHKAARFGNPFRLTGQIEDYEDGAGKKALRLGWKFGQEPEWRT